MKKLAQGALLVVAVSLLFSAPDAFAIDNCQVCKAVSTGEGAYIFCGQPSNGGIGARYCFLEDDGSGGVYCHTEGDWCCVTGPAY